MTQRADREHKGVQKTTMLEGRFFSAESETGGRKIVSIDIEEVTKQIKETENGGEHPKPRSEDETKVADARLTAVDSCNNAQQRANKSVNFPANPPLSHGPEDLSLNASPTMVHLGMDATTVQSPIPSQNDDAAASRRAGTQSPYRLQSSAENATGEGALRSRRRERGVAPQLSTESNTATSIPRRRATHSPDACTTATASAKGKLRKSVGSAIHDDTLGLAQQLAKATATLQIDLDAARAALELRDKRILELESGMLNMKLETESTLMHERKLYEYEVQSCRKLSEKAAFELQQKDREINELRDRNSALHSDNRRLAVEHKDLIVKHHELSAEMQTYRSLSSDYKASQARFFPSKELGSKVARLENAIKKLLEILERAQPDACPQKTVESRLDSSAPLADIHSPGGISVLISKLDSLGGSFRRTIATARGCDSTAGDIVQDESGSSDEWQCNEIDRNSAGAAAIRLQGAIRGRQARQATRALILENMRLLQQADGSHWAYDGGCSSGSPWGDEQGGAGTGTAAHREPVLVGSSCALLPAERSALASAWASVPGRLDSGVRGQRPEIAITECEQDERTADGIRLRVEVESEEEGTEDRFQVAVKLAVDGEWLGPDRVHRQEGQDGHFDSLAALAKVETFLLKCLRASAPPPAKGAVGDSPASAVHVAHAHPFHREDCDRPSRRQPGEHAASAPSKGLSTVSPPPLLAPLVDSPLLPVSFSSPDSDPSKRLSISRIMLEKELNRIGELEWEMVVSRGDTHAPPGGGKRLSISRIILQNELRRMKDVEAGANSGVSGAGAVAFDASGRRWDPASPNGIPQVTFSPRSTELHLSDGEMADVEVGEVGKEDGRVSTSRILLEKELETIAGMASAGDDREGEDDAQGKKRLSISRIILEKELRRMKRVEARAGKGASGSSDQARVVHEPKRLRPLPLEAMAEEAADEGGIARSPSFGRLDSSRSMDSHMSISRIMLEAELQTCCRMLESSRAQVAGLAKALQVNVSVFGKSETTAKRQVLSSAQIRMTCVACGRSCVCGRVEKVKKTIARQPALAC